MIKSILFPIFILLIVAWIFIAALRTFGYINKLVFSDLPKTKSENYPDYEYAAMKRFVEEKISSSKENNFVFSSNDGRKFFLVRYFAYPKKVYWLEEGRFPDNINAVFIKD